MSFFFLLGPKIVAARLFFFPHIGFSCCFSAATIVHFQHSVNSQSRQSLSGVLLRFLAHWATAIVPSLTQRSQVLALTGEIKVLVKSLL